MVDYSALGAQAIAQVERTRKQAATQLAAAMQQRPKLALHAQLDGPKIAVPIPASPDGQGAALWNALDTSCSWQTCARVPWCWTCLSVCLP